MFRPLSALALSCCIFSAGVAADNKVAVVTVNNPTQDLTLTFDYRWGDGKWETLKALPAGKAMTFSHPLDGAGKAPGFQVKMNRAIGKAKPLIKTWDLNWKPAPKAAAELGTQYEIFRDLIDREYVWLEAVGQRP